MLGLRETNYQPLLYKGLNQNERLVRLKICIIFKLQKTFFRLVVITKDEW